MNIWKVEAVIDPALPNCGHGSVMEYTVVARSAASALSLVQEGHPGASVDIRGVTYVCRVNYLESELP